MPVRGPLAHVDITVSDLSISIPFWSRVLRHLGFRALKDSDRVWVLGEGRGATFEIALQRADDSLRDRPHDRHAPGLHHIAFHADSRDFVDQTHRLVVELGGTVLDAPAEYSGKAYTPGYYAVFLADPDGIKLEVCHIPASNP